jgi:prophage antirepressor-like protein
MNNLQTITNPFLFSNNEVRTAIGPDGAAWFCAKDVFDVLGIAWKGRAGSLINIPEKWQGDCYFQTPGGVQEMIFLSEPAVYKVTLSSRKPEAEEFANWVFEEVLPAIRKQGFYGTVPARDRVHFSRQISAIAEHLSKTKDAMLHQLLTAELRDLCNLIGRPMPDINLLGKDYRQLELPMDAQR